MPTTGLTNENSLAVDVSTSVARRKPDWTARFTARVTSPADCASKYVPPPAAAIALSWVSLDGFTPTTNSVIFRFTPAADTSRSEFCT